METPRLFEATNKEINPYLLYFPKGLEVNRMVYELTEKSDIKTFNTPKFLFLNKRSKKGIYLRNYFFQKKVEIFIPFSELKEIDL